MGIRQVKLASLHLFLMVMFYDFCPLRSGQLQSYLSLTFGAFSLLTRLMQC